MEEKREKLLQHERRKEKGKIQYKDTYYVTSATFIIRKDVHSSLYLMLDLCHARNVVLGVVSSDLIFIVL